ncbi:uncharacterized protein [Apostichopus japonicus]|uniref:uncharacterized protein n=1 Tax=Stichopus japonicus TaxID=307972 RepID=UPI003AB16752
MTVHLFGATSSPSCAGFALRKTAEDHKNAFDKDTSTAVLESFYVDDCLKSVPDAEQARRLSHLRPIREEDIVPDSGGSGTEYCSETNRFVYPHLGSRGHSTSYIPVQNADITSNLTSDTESDGSSYIPSDDEKDNSSSISDDEPIQTRDLRQYIIADTSTNGQSDADSNCSHTTDEQSSSANDEPTPTTDHAGKKKRLKDDDNEDDSSEEENSEGRRQLSTLVNETPYEDETHGDKREANMEVNQVRQKQSRKRKPSMKGVQKEEKKRAWTTSENEAVLRHFQNYVQLHRIPNK